MQLVLKAARGAWFWFWGHLFACLFYDKRCLRGRHFEGKLHGLCARGWQWVTIDALSRLRFCAHPTARYPIAYGCKVQCPENIVFDPDDLNNFQNSGSYFQAVGRIVIGKGSYIAPNVGLITANHDPLDPERHLPAREIRLGEKCWIGMNSVILPGVCLGDHTVVGAGSVVTKSFEKGYCVIAGNPARVLRELPAEPGAESEA